MDSLDETILKYALQNAIGYNGRANPGSVTGRVLGERPDAKADVKGLNQAVMRIVKEVNALSLDQQKEKLATIAPELLVKEKKEREFKLPDLPDVKGNVVMRFAPNPSGPLHIGHSRVVMLTDEYVKRYGGRFINRFEDTDPARVDPEAYDIIPKTSNGSVPRSPRRTSSPTGWRSTTTWRRSCSRTGMRTCATATWRAGAS